VAQIYDDAYQKDVVKQAISLGESMVEGVKETLGITPAGASSPTDDELAAFFFHQQTVYPPQLFTYPDGTQVFASPWILALDFVEGGKEWLARFERVKAKNGGI
jgi:hypothetical protein